MRYSSTDWSLDMPAGWQYTEHPECVTFEPPSGDSAFQISAYRKPDGEVTPEDLRDFAGDIPITEVSFVHFNGVQARYNEANTFWAKWWLRHGSSMLHVTYNCSLACRGRDDAAVESMLQSLRLSVAAPSV
jgi:hypothetical protein